MLSGSRKRRPHDHGPLVRSLIANLRLDCSGGDEDRWLHKLVTHVHSTVRRRSGHGATDELVNLITSDVVRSLQHQCGLGTASVPLGVSVLDLGTLVLGEQNVRSTAEESQPSVLVAYLVASPVKAQGTGTVGCLYLEDGSHAVPAEFIDLNPDTVGCLVLATSFSFIVVNDAPGHNPRASAAAVEGRQAKRPANALEQPCQAYVEVTDFSVVWQDPSESRNIQTPCIDRFMDYHKPVSIADTAKQAEQLAMYKKVDVYGHVTALSPVMRIREQVFWFARLSSETTEDVPVRQVVSTVVCMYGAALAHWHAAVTLNKQYLFTGLVNKRFPVLDGQKVLTSGPSSRIYLSSRGVGPVVGERKRTVTGYEGVITDTSGVDCGVYELDGQRWLMLTHQENVRCGRGLRVGTRVRLHHVHPLFDRDFGKEVQGFACCIFSTVEICSFSDDPGQTYRPLLLGSGEMSFLRHNMNAYEAWWALKCCAVIAAKFPPYFQHHNLNTDFHVLDSPRDLVRLFLRLPARNKASAWRWLQYILQTNTAWAAPPRDIYTEFFCHADSNVCRVAVPRLSPYPPFVWVKDILGHDRVKEFIANVSAALNDRAQYDANGLEDLNMVTAWEDVAGPGALLVALLDGSRGRLVLKDSSGEIEVLMPMCNTATLRHICCIRPMALVVEFAGYPCAKPAFRVYLRCTRDAVQTVREWRQVRTRAVLEEDRTTVRAVVLAKHAADSLLEVNLLHDLAIAPHCPCSARVMFEGDGKKWFPAISIGSCFQFQNVRLGVTESCPVRPPCSYYVVDSDVVEGEPTVKVLVQAREKGVAARTQAVVEDEETGLAYAQQLAMVQSQLRANCAQVYGVMELYGAFADLEGGMQAALNRVRTVRGVVCKRAFRSDEQTNLPSTLFLQLRDLHGQNMLGVYINITTNNYPIGLMVNALVTCHRVQPKLSRSRMFLIGVCQTAYAEPLVTFLHEGCGIHGSNALCLESYQLPETAVASVSSRALDCSRPAAEPMVLDEEMRKTIPCKYLAEIGDTRSGVRTMCRLLCTVVLVLGVSLRHTCGTCGTTITRQQGCHTCRSSAERYACSAKVIVEDGSAEAQVHIEGEGLVLSTLLGLSPADAAALTRHIAERGVVQYRRLGAGARVDPGNMQDELLDRHVLAPHVYRPLVLYCKPFFNARLDGAAPGFETRSLNLGGSFLTQTLAVPTIRLTAEHIEEAKPLRELRRLIVAHTTM